MRPRRSPPRIARWADGLPLAIELAAARLNALGLADLQSVVERRLALLRDRAASDRLRGALQELVEWSYELLHADEKTLLHLIAVHRGRACLPSLLGLAELADAPGDAPAAAELRARVALVSA